MNARACHPLAALAAAFALLAPTATRAVDLTGTLESDTRLTAAGNPHRITGGLTVPVGVTLTLEAGVELVALQYTSIAVRGSLVVSGTTENPVVIRGDAPNAGYWYGIDVTAGGSATLRHARLLDAGYYLGYGILHDGPGTLAMEGVTIDTTSGDGLRLGGSANFTGLGNTYTRANFGVRMHPNVTLDDPLASFSGNNADIHVDGGTISRAVTWNVPPTTCFDLRGSLGIGTGGHLMIPAGNTVKVRQYLIIDVVDGRLTATGTASAPVVFTDTRDDSVGGDLNRDGTDSQPAPAWWYGLDVRGGGVATLSFAEVRYAGYYLNRGVRVTTGGSLVATDCTFRDASIDGMLVEGATGPVALTRCTFRDNTSSGLLIAGAAPEVSACIFRDHPAFGLWMSVDANVHFPGQTFIANGLADVGIGEGTRTTPWSWERGGGDPDFDIRIGSITLAPGSGLTIGPGVTVESDQYKQLRVQGALVANGTAANPVRLVGTTTTPHWWYGILADGASTTSLTHVELRDAGYYENAGIRLNDTAALTLLDCDFVGIGGDGIRLRGSGPVTSTRSHFEGCNYGIRMNPDVTWLDDEATFAANNRDIVIDGGTIAGETTWDFPSSTAAVLFGGATIAEGGVLNVNPGTHLKFERYQTLAVRGSLLAQARGDAPIVFTSDLDDSVGGDTNRNGDATAPFPGYWTGIDCLGSGNVVFGNVQLRYAGYYHQRGVRFTGSGVLSLVESSITDIEGNGIAVHETTGERKPLAENSLFARCGHQGAWLDNTEMGFVDCTFAANANFGAAMVPGTVFDFSANTFLGNGLACVGVTGGDLFPSARWTRGKGDPFTLEVLGSVSIPSGHDFVIDPGVTMKFRRYQDFSVRGTLHAGGDPALPTVFTGTTPSADWWYGLHVLGAGEATVHDCVVEWAGYYRETGIMFQGTGRLDLQRSVIRDTDGHALYVDTSATLVSRDNRFERAWVGVLLRPYGSFDDPSSTFADCGSAVHLIGGSVGTEATWGVHPAHAIRVDSWVEVPAAGSLTIRAGTVLKFDRTEGLNVLGRLDVQGTADLPVTFTDIRDDSVGGDSNGNGTADTPAPGWWSQIYIHGTADTTMSHARVRHAGYYDSVGIRVLDSAKLHLVGCGVSNIAGSALRIDGSGPAVILQGNSFEGSGVGVDVYDRTVETDLKGSRIVGNSAFGVRNTRSATIDARETWWGSETGPRHATNAQGTGDTISDGVLYDPWAGATPKVLAVAVTPADSGTVTVDPVLPNHVHGSVATLTAVPAEGSTFLRWEGDASGSDNPLAVVMNAHKSITAVFGEQPPPAALTVNLDPEAVRATGRWSIDGGTTWREHGSTAMDLPAGDVTVVFQAVSGWVTPTPFTATIVAGETITRTGTYAENPVTGVIAGFIEPEAARGEARWSIDGGTTWYQHSAQVFGLPLGQYTMTFSAVDGWITPDSVPITLTKEMPFGGATGTYVQVQEHGYLLVTIHPEAVRGEARWSIDNGVTWMEHAIPLPGVPTGQVTVTFKDVPGWTKPADQQVNILPSTLNEASGTYTPAVTTGAITGLIFPEAVQPLARWSIDGGTTWYQHTQHVFGLPLGAYTVTFSKVDGWATPDPIELTLSELAPVASPTGTYGVEGLPLGVTYTAGPQLPTGRMAHNAYVFDDGTVGLFGGHGPGFVALGTAEFLIPDVDAWITAPMVSTHDGGFITRLGNGRLLLGGGAADYGIPAYAAVEAYNHDGVDFSPAGSMVRFRAGSTAVTLPDGKVAIVGGWWNHNDAHTYGELHDPATGTFTAKGPFPTARSHPVVVPLAGGEILVLGGVGPMGGSLTSVDRIDPVAGTGSRVADQLFAGETGWTVFPDRRAMADQYLGPDSMLFLATRTSGALTQQRLFTVDTTTGAIAPFVDLPDDIGPYFGHWQPLIDHARQFVWLVGYETTGGLKLRLGGVHLPSRTVFLLGDAYAFENWSVSYASISLLRDGRILFAGGNLTSNFDAQPYTLFLEPRFPEPGYATWIASFDAVPVERRAPDEDPDHDGKPNVLEYLYDTDPGVHTPGPLPMVMSATPHGMTMTTRIRNRVDLEPVLEWTHILDEDYWMATNSSHVTVEWTPDKVWSDVRLEWFAEPAFFRWNLRLVSPGDPSGSLPAK